GPVDVAFLDGIDKKQSRRYFELIWPAVRKGGSVFTDNTQTHPEELADYVRFARSRPDAVSTEIPIGNGVEWTVKL
ncbi:MAG: putative O-methyltransferase, partial [Phycisphaerales bacterium]|nr:putative O-methyltransferase [Phycisphaerales bacterium]